MQYFKCDRCKYRLLCKFAEIGIELEDYLEDWQNNFMTDDIFDIEMTCKYFME